MDMARYVACYRQWIAAQEAGLGELEAASANATAGLATDADLWAAVERCMLGYQDYVTGRRALSREDGTAFFAPPWCTAFENSVLWLGGCRPSLTIRLLYSLTGEGLEAQLEEFIGGRHSNGVPAGGIGVTARQLALINDLHRQTLRQEDALSERLATLQEDVADRPLLPIVRELESQRATATAMDVAGCDGLAGRPGLGVDAEVDAALGSYKAGLARLLVEADELWMATARATATEILTPRQALEMLVAAKQLHLSVRDWSRRREGAQQQHVPPPRAVSSATPAAVRPIP